MLWVDTVELAWVTILAHYGHQQRERAAALAALAAGTELRVPTQARHPRMRVCLRPLLCCAGVMHRGRPCPACGPA